MGLSGERDLAVGLEVNLSIDILINNVSTVGRLVKHRVMTIRVVVRKSAGGGGRFCGWEGEREEGGRGDEKEGREDGEEKRKGGKRRKGKRKRREDKGGREGGGTKKKGVRKGKRRGRKEKEGGIRKV